MTCKHSYGKFEPSDFSNKAIGVCESHSFSRDWIIYDILSGINVSSIITDPAYIAGIDVIRVSTLGNHKGKPVFVYNFLEDYEIITLGGGEEYDPWSSPGEPSPHHYSGDYIFIPESFFPLTADDWYSEFVFGRPSSFSLRSGYTSSDIVGGYVLDKPYTNYYLNDTGLATGNYVSSGMNFNKSFGVMNQSFDVGHLPWGDDGVHDGTLMVWFDSDYVDDIYNGCIKQEGDGGYYLAYRDRYKLKLGINIVEDVDYSVTGDILGYGPTSACIIDIKGLNTDDGHYSSPLCVYGFGKSTLVGGELRLKTNLLGHSSVILDSIDEGRIFVIGETLRFNGNTLSVLYFKTYLSSTSYYSDVKMASFSGHKDDILNVDEWDITDVVTISNADLTSLNYSFCTRDTVHLTAGGRVSFIYCDGLGENAHGGLGYNYLKSVTSKGNNPSDTDDWVTEVIDSDLAHQICPIHPIIHGKYGSSALSAMTSPIDKETSMVLYTKIARGFSHARPYFAIEGKSEFYDVLALRGESP